jgi:hypothetical protein
MQFLFRMSQTGDYNLMPFAQMPNHIERANFASPVRWIGQTMADEKDPHRALLG